MVGIAGIVFPSIISFSPSSWSPIYVLLYYYFYERKKNIWLGLGSKQTGSDPDPIKL
jgi:hypothetical protein